MYTFRLFPSLSDTYLYFNAGNNPSTSRYKKDKPYTEKLRIIKLTEEHLNAGLKILLGRRLMRHAENTAYIVIKPMVVDRTVVHMAIIISQLSSNIIRINRIHMLVNFKNANEYYYLMRPEL